MHTQVIDRVLFVYWGFRARRQLRSFCAHNVILIKQDYSNFELDTTLAWHVKPNYERASAASERSLFSITDKSQYERPGLA